MIQYENKWFAYAFAIIPVLVLLYLFSSGRRKKLLERFGEFPLVQRLVPEVSPDKRLVKMIFFATAFILLIIAVINPMIGTKLEEVKREGADIIITLDVSNSMKAEDLYPNRLEKAKQSISKLIDKLTNDRIGIIVFAGEAYTQLPITSDYPAAKLFLESVDCDLVPVQGTNIGEAIDLAVESFGSTEGKNKAIVVISDGEDHEGGVDDALKNASEKGVTVSTIGMGSLSGVPIPVYRNGGRTNEFKKDKDGNTVITKINEPMLQQIAAAGNGVYVRATSSDAGLNAVYDKLNSLQKKTFESRVFSEYEDRFQYFTLAALVLLLAEFIISERRSEWWRKLNLFKEKQP